MTPYLEIAVKIACDLYVTQQKETTNVKKNKTPNYFINKIKYHMYNRLSFKNLYIYYIQFNHSSRRNA